MLSRAETAACLAGCVSLTELTLKNSELAHLMNQPVYLVPLPRLRYLHVVAQHVVAARRQTLDAVLTPNLTHVALLLHQSQAVQMMPSINAERLPHLTHCYCHLDVDDFDDSDDDWDEESAYRALHELPGAARATERHGRGVVRA